MKDEKCVYYSEFGAVGDGVAEDFPAIIKCHEYANANRLKVKADKGAKYYIGETGGVYAPIKTDVDWQDATFILDDKAFSAQSPSRGTHIFRIYNDYEKKRYGETSEQVKALNERGGIKADTTDNIGYKPGYTALLVVYDYEHSAYNRFGAHATGKPNAQKELIVVDADGNIDENTKFLLDYAHVSCIEEFRTDDEPITIEGGTFITLANDALPYYTYYARGLQVNRSNTTIKNLVHKVKDEGDIGAPYVGFIHWGCINNLTCENLTLSSHKSYKEYSYDEEGMPTEVHSVMGSYDVGGSFATNVRFVNCVQENFWKWKEKRIAYCEWSERWGIMGTNYCKNLIYDGCTLSRLDAHAGVYNVIIKDTTISYIYLTGGGTAKIENAKVVSPEGDKTAFLLLRGDYGSTWRGDILIKDCEFINWPSEKLYLVHATWNNWDFGYTTYLPRVTVDNLKIARTGGKIYVFNEITKDESIKLDKKELDTKEENLNPMRIDTTVRILNNENGYEYLISPNRYVSEKIKIEKN